jgi:hypothetical protein
MSKSSCLLKIYGITLVKSYIMIIMIMNYIYIAHFSYGYVQVRFFKDKSNDNIFMSFNEHCNFSTVFIPHL